MQQALYDQLVNRKVKPDFGMYSNPNENSAAPNYDPRDKSIKFKNNSTITKENLKEELFHAWQDAYYEGGIYQYRETGKVNIEFEAKVFKDLIKDIVGSVSAFFATETDEMREDYFEYILWLEDVRKYPILLEDTNIYNYWLDLFNKHNPFYSSSKSKKFKLFHGLSNLNSNSKCF